jgi:V/A-type H+-transporting ATPase subunit A
MDMVYVGNLRLIGEVVGVHEDETTVQVYEETTGLRPGEPVTTTGLPMSVTLGPGLLDNIFDGIARPLRYIEKSSGNFISRGINVTSLDKEREWDVSVLVKAGDVIESGQIFAETQETPLIRHRCPVPPNVKGVVKSVKPDGKYTVDDVIAEIESNGKIISLSLSQKWPIRKPRQL